MVTINREDYEALPLVKLGSANLALIGFNLLTDDENTTHLYRETCWDELERRGHYILRGMHNTDEWRLPPEEVAKLLEHFGPTRLRDESREHILFTHVMNMKNPWR